MDISRIQLHKKLPLRTPFSLHIFPSYFCNFRCIYCLHSLAEDELQKLEFKRQLMDFGTLKKAVDSLKEFPEKLKAIIFAGHGEPLIHKDIAKMVEYAKRMNVADRVELVTNASLLEPGLSDKLIAAGLDRIRISIQGVTFEKYKAVSGVEMDFVQFVENIRYFYSNRKNTQVYIKIIDTALDGMDEGNRFYDIFQPICDMAAIEYTIPFVSGMDYSKSDTGFTRCKQGHKRSSNICSMPFYMLVLEPNGNVIPCCSPMVPLIYGNINDMNMREIWNSEKLKSFLRQQLIDRSCNDVCKRCSVPAFGLQEGDYLDGYEEDLLKYY